MIPSRDLGDKAVLESCELEGGRGAGGWATSFAASALEAGDPGMVGANLTVTIDRVQCGPQSSGFLQRMHEALLAVHACATAGRKIVRTPTHRHREVLSK